MAELVHEKCGCGEFPVTKHEHDNWITECGCGMNTGWHDGQADARDAWNRALRRHLQGCTMNKPNWTGGCSCGQEGLTEIYHHTMEWLKTATVRAEASEARNAAMLRALEPFADIDGEGDEDFPDNTKVTVMFGRTTSYSLTLGDFREARAAAAKGETV